MNQRLIELYFAISNINLHICHRMFVWGKYHNIVVIMIDDTIYHNNNAVMVNVEGSQLAAYSHRL